MLWKEIAKLELLSGSTRIALIEPNRFLNREEPNRRGTDTTRTALRFFFTFLKPNEPKRTAGSLSITPWKINIEHKDGGGWFRCFFRFQLGDPSIPAVHFQACIFILGTITHPLPPADTRETNDNDGSLEGRFCMP